MGAANLDQLKRASHRQAEPAPRDLVDADIACAIGQAPPKQHQPRLEIVTGIGQVNARVET
jgi:hypothetical protein